MLTQASDYRYCSPIAAGIKGEPFPIRDGTHEGHVVRYEDLVFLVEMHCERYSWATRDDPAAHGVAPYWFSAILGRLVNPYIELRDLLLLVGGNAYYGALGFQIRSSTPGVIAADWNFTNPPFVEYGDNTRQQWFASMQPTLRCMTYLDDFADEYGVIILPRPEEANTLRMIYSDLADIKRYLFPNRYPADGAYTDFVTPANNGFYDNWHDALFGPVYYGTRTIVDGDYTQDVAEQSFAPPWRAEYYYRGNEPELYLSHSEQQMRFYIKSPYYLNTAQTPAVPYYTRPVLYARYKIAASWNGDTANDPSGRVSTRMILPMYFTPTVNTVNLGPFEGEITISKRDVGMELSMAYNAAKNWAQGELVGFQNNDWQLSVTLNEVYLDTGVITHNAIIPAAPA